MRQQQIKTENWMNYGKFSKKHIDYIKNAFKYRFLCAEGAVRSGKTVDHCIIFAFYLETCPDKIHLASGSTLPNAKLNIGDCNGFGLEYLFKGRCRWGKYKDNEALYIQTSTGEKIVIFTGGGKANSYTKILGNSYGGWIATEINEHYDSDDSRTSFIKVAMARQLASKKPFTLWDLNPSNPNDDIYSLYIDNYLQFPWYHYEHFNIFDNATLTAERIKEIEDTYNKASIWYQRDILGIRAVAEGLIFRYFADDEERFLFDYDEEKDKYTHRIIGVDFGDNGSIYSWTLTGFKKNWKNLDILDEGCMEKSNGIDAKQLCIEFIRFYRMCLEVYGRIDYVFCDSASNTLINTLRTACKEEGLPYSGIGPVVKNEIKERLEDTDLLLTTGRMRVNRKCKHIRNMFSQLRWDKEKKDTVEDKNINNINDFWDSCCYTWITHKDYVETKR